MWQPGPAPPPPAVVLPEAQGVLAGAAGFVSRDMSDPPCISIVPAVVGDVARAPARAAQLWLCSSLMAGGKCPHFCTSVRQNNIIEPFALFVTSCYNKTDLYQSAVDGMAGHVESTMHQFVDHVENSNYMPAFRAVARQIGKAGGSVVAALAMEPLQKLLTGAVYTFNASKTYEAAYVRKSYNLTKNSNKAYEVVFKNSAGAEVSRLLVCVPYEFGCLISNNACLAAYNREGVSEIFASYLWAEVYDGKDSRPDGV